MKLNINNNNYHHKDNNFSINNQDNKKFSLKNIWKNNFFVLFAFTNLFIPIFLTMMSALGDYNNAEFNIVNVGLTTSFLTIFNQMMINFSIGALFLIFLKYEKRKLKDAEESQSTAFFIALIFSLIVFILFIATSTLYVVFSEVYKNFHTYLIVGLRFILMSAPSLLFNMFQYILLMLILKRNGNRHGVFFNILFTFITFIVVAIISVAIPWENEYETFSIGLGLTLSSIINLIIIVVYSYLTKLIKISVYKIHFSVVKEIGKKLTNYSVGFILATIMKSFLVFGIALGTSTYNRDTNVSQMISKIIWYHSLYFIGFLGDGIVMTIDYLKIRNFKTRTFDEKFWKKLIIFTIGGTFLIAIMFGFILKPLSNLYSLNTGHGIDSISIMNNLWQPFGLQGVIVDPSGNILIKNVRVFAYMYICIYHLFLSGSKIAGLKQFQFSHYSKFDWKGFTSSFIMLSAVMITISLFGILPAKLGNVQMQTLFPSLDSFSFALMLIVALLFGMSLLGVIKSKKNVNKCIMQIVE